MLKLLNYTGLTRVVNKLRNLIKTNSDNITSLNEKTDATNVVVSGLSNYLNDAYTVIDDNTSDILINKSSLGLQKKNLLNNTATTTTKNGVTYTVNDDKSIIISGTATADISIRLNTSVYMEKGVTYAFNGLVERDDYGCYTDIYDSSWNWIKGIYHVSGQFTPTKTDTYKVTIQIPAGTDFTNNVTLYPMIRYAGITDDTYETYVDDVQKQLNGKLGVDETAKAATSAGTVNAVQKQLCYLTSQESPLSVIQVGLFTNYNMLLCNVNTLSSGTTTSKYNIMLPLKYIKSLGTDGIYSVDDQLMFTYVDENTLKVRTGMGQSNPTITKFELITIY